MLSEEQKQRVIAEARRSGVSESAAIAAAEKIRESDTPNPGATPKQEEKPEGPVLVAERFLIGYLPFVTVAEFRSKVLGLEGTVADDHLFTGEWLNIHGQQTSAAPAATGATDDDDPKTVEPSDAG